MRRIFSFLSVPFALSVGAFVVAACNSDSTSSTTQNGSKDDGSKDDGDPKVPAAACETSCKSKVSSCGGSEEQATAACERTCGGGLTAKQLSCLQTKSCEELAQGESIEEICPAGASDDNDPPPSDDCSSEPTCTPEGDGIRTCEIVNGVPTTRTDMCGTGRGKCKDAKCGYCTKKEECQSYSFDYCNCKDGTSETILLEYDCAQSWCISGQPVYEDCSATCKDHGGPKE